MYAHHIERAQGYRIRQQNRETTDGDFGKPRQDVVVGKSVRR
jgi:hypothetical protein